MNLCKLEWGVVMHKKQIQVEERTKACSCAIIENVFLSLNGNQNYEVRGNFISPLHNYKILQ